MPVTDSPLRYPGGKTKLYGLVSELVSMNVSSGSTYVEPFAGGAGLALKLLYHGDVSRLVLNDIDDSIFCFWDSCLNNTEAMCKMVVDCKPTIEVWDYQRMVYNNPYTHSELERGFATLFLNRCNISGVICGGPIGGRQQSGRYLLDARYNPVSLTKKIEKIGYHRENILFSHMDAAEFLKTLVAKMRVEDTFVNIDPPYVRKGPMLYRNSFSTEDHVSLSYIIKSLQQKWITTYDKCDLIRQLYCELRIREIVLNYSAGGSKHGDEFLVLGDSVVEHLHENVGGNNDSKATHS